ncbi:hypothetical protein PQR71_35845 [Paraburkholderia fungorum]|uniref:hypothetical protein n=1 Tax=Paraburkholderia fungorum TaxID=134537 RepID=UPI0038BA7A75
MESKGRYEAAFIIPVPNEKCLGDTGWEFKSERTLPKATREFLAGSLKLTFSENFSGMSTYENDVLKATVIENDVGEIEQVHLKLYGMTKKQLSLLFQDSPLASDAELFFPEVE